MKKTNKLIAILLIIAMTTALCISSSFAEQSAALEEDIDNVLLAKDFIIPEGVADPTIDTAFEFAPNTSKSTGLKANETLPDADDVEITYTGTEQKTAAGKTVTVTANLPEPEFTHAGVYAYDVTEKTPEIKNPTTGVNNSVEPDPAKYRVRYYVVSQDKEEGEGTELVIKYVTVSKVTTTEVDGEPVEQEEKIDSYIPGEGSDPASSNFKFSNTYKVTNGAEQDPEGPIDPNEVALKVQKTVTGTNPPSGAKFPFTINLTSAAGQTVEGLEAYIFNSNGTRATKTEDVGGEATEVDLPAVVVSGGSASFELESGQFLAFLQLPAGTRYKVAETLNQAEGTEVYTPSYTVSSNDQSYTGAESAGNTLTTAGEGNGVDTYLLASMKKDTVAYTNAYDNSINTPTGILMNNLPYIILLLVAFGGLTAYIVSRRRREQE